MVRPTIDVFGHCIHCGKKLITTKVIDGKEQIVFTGDRDETQYLLDDGSHMRVMSCRKCKEDLDGSEVKPVMKAVVRGWQHELETYSMWPQDRKDKYMDKYGKLKIVVRSDNKEPHVLKKIFKEHKVKKDKVKKEKSIGNHK